MKQLIKKCQQGDKVITRNNPHGVKTNSRVDGKTYTEIKTLGYPSNTQFKREIVNQDITNPSIISDTSYFYSDDAGRFYRADNSRFEKNRKLFEALTKLFDKYSSQVPEAERTAGGFTSKEYNY